jgi:hypothetical protein
MHPMITVMHWGHHLHGNLLVAWDGIDQHLHSRHFWVGVAVTLLIVGFVALMGLLLMHAPASPARGMPYGFPYGPY